VYAIRPLETFILKKKILVINNFLLLFKLNFKLIIYIYIYLDFFRQKKKYKQIQYEIYNYILFIVDIVMSLMSV